jgi:hypothetical protein
MSSLYDLTDLIKSISNPKKNVTAVAAAIPFANPESLQ